jgi:hypothetical protein
LHNQLLLGCLLVLIVYCVAHEFVETLYGYRSRGRFSSGSLLRSILLERCSDSLSAER